MFFLLIISHYCVYHLINCFHIWLFSIIFIFAFYSFIQYIFQFFSGLQTHVCTFSLYLFSHHLFSHTSFFVIYFQIHTFSSLTLIYFFCTCISQSIGLYPLFSWHVHHLSDNFHICVISIFIFTSFA